jgi:DNA-binding transcriptional ArsR family regulator
LYAPVRVRAVVDDEVLQIDCGRVGRATASEQLAALDRWRKRFFSLAIVREPRQNHFVCFLNDKMNANLTRSIQALGNDRRLKILEWLKEPTRHFPPQRDGDLVKDGVCGLLIARKLHVSHSAVTQHLKILAQAGFLTGKRIKKWTFFKRNERAIRAAKQAISKRV